MNFKGTIVITDPCYIIKKNPIKCPNEAWEYEVYQGQEYGLDLLQFEPEEITDIEYSVIKNHLPVGTLDVMDDLLNYLEDRANLENSEDIYKMTPEQVMKIIDAIAK